MITKEDIDRINFLARKSKTQELTNEEKEEQQKLRRKYIDWIKHQVRTQLDSIEIVDDHDQKHDHKHGPNCGCHKH
ncbi:MAG: DUF896 domain-containing protein [Lutispora sp.]|jgi:uncharacterized protein YnzC (UPF0291/DUF896 family)|uniref:DUF896 domain-containing protein n=1 Tax=Lutispora sp. TaxID=2828727 RepID=UPI00356996B8